VSGRLARDIEPLRILPLPRIAVGRPEENHHPLVLRDLHTRRFGVPISTVEDAPMIGLLGLRSCLTAFSEGRTNRHNHAPKDVVHHPRCREVPPGYGDK
jgi:hypothetical protein